MDSFVLVETPEGAHTFELQWKRVKFYVTSPLVLEELKKIVFNLLHTPFARIWYPSADNKTRVAVTSDSDLVLAVTTRGDSLSLRLQPVEQTIENREQKVKERYEEVCGMLQATEDPHMKARLEKRRGALERRMSSLSARKEGKGRQGGKQGGKQGGNRCALKRAVLQLEETNKKLLHIEELLASSSSSPPEPLLLQGRDVALKRKEKQEERVRILEEVHTRLRKRGVDGGEGRAVREATKEVRKEMRIERRGKVKRVEMGREKKARVMERKKMRQMLSSFGGMELQEQKEQQE